MSHSSEDGDDAGDHPPAEQDGSGANDTSAPTSQPNAARTEQKSPEGAVPRRERDWFAIFSLVFDLIVAVCAILGGYFIYDQLRLMHQSNALTREALDFAKEGAKGSAADTANALSLAERSARAAERAAAVTEQALLDSRNAAHTQQRAWVGIGGALIDPAFSVGSKAGFDLRIKNSGRTPATRVVASARIKYLKRGETFSPGMATYSPPNESSTSVIPSDGEVRLTPGRRQPYTAEEIEALRSGSLRLYVYGRYSYYDVFGQRHQGTFCFFLDEGLTELNVCDTYNTAG